MAKELILMAEPRTVLGKQNKALRRSGKVPGVIYGPGMDGTIQVAVERRALERTYIRIGLSTLLTVDLDGDAHHVMINEVQQDPITRAPLHVDFFRPNLLKPMEAAVPVVLRGEPRLAGVMLSQSTTDVMVRALPSDIPLHIDYDISDVTLASAVIRAGDLTLPKGVTLVTDPDQAIASIQAVGGEADADETAEAPEAATAGDAPAAES